MKRSFSSSSFGLSQDIPLTSPTMTPFLACHSSAKSYFQENQSCIHNSDCSGCSFDNKRDALHDVSLEIKNDIAKHESMHSSHDHFASDFEHQYQREWNYQDICNHYRDSRQHLLMEQYQEEFFGDINQIYSANSDEIDYNPDNNGTIGHYIDMSLMYSGDVVGVSPGSYLASSHFHMEAIASAADVVSMNYSEQKSSHSRETMEMGLDSESDRLFDQSHSHSISLSLESEEYEDEILHTKKKSAILSKKTPKKALGKKPAKASGRGGVKHVGKACTHCKKAHLACDNSRPCKRCTHLGKEDCIDVEHKRRGRPRTSPEKHDSNSLLAVTIHHNLDLSADHHVKDSDRLIALAAE